MYDIWRHNFEVLGTSYTIFQVPSPDEVVNTAAAIAKKPSTRISILLKSAFMAIKHARSSNQDAAALHRIGESEGGGLHQPWR